MKNSAKVLIATLGLIPSIVPLGGARADMLGELRGIFNEVLDEATLGISGTGHGEHFIPNKNETSQRTVDVLTNFINANISSFPLSSTASGSTIAFVGGVPVSEHFSGGPIFAERALTLGANRLNFGLNVSRLNLAQLRGVKTEDISFTFTHEDRETSGLGDILAEFDTIELLTDLDLNATIVALHLTYGVTDRIDLGIALPMVSIHMRANPTARFTSTSFVANDRMALHFFQDESQDRDSTNPKLATTLSPVDERTSGVGDIALRGKINFFNSAALDAAVLVEARLPTGQEENFLGSGASSLKGLLIVSTTRGSATPHINIGYDIRNSEFDRDDFEIVLGYDQKISNDLTIAVEWMGEFEIGDEIAAVTFPGPTEIGPFDLDNDEPQVVTHVISPTNIPARSRDHIMRTSFGLRYSPKRRVGLFANVILPTNSGGLRSDFIATFGLELGM